MFTHLLCLEVTPDCLVLKCVLGLRENKGSFLPLRVGRGSSRQGLAHRFLSRGIKILKDASLSRVWPGSLSTQGPGHSTAAAQLGSGVDSGQRATGQRGHHSVVGIFINQAQPDLL